MDKSDSITELAKALSKMQGVLKSVPKDSANPFFKSKYASLDAIWETVRAPLTDNGLSIIQTTFGERIILETTLLHSSGEWVRSYLPINAAKTDPQGIGSALTYARRYSLAAILGVSADEDDDGEATTNHNPKVEPKQTAETKEHWCKEHNTAFFMRGKMKSYAHPIGDTGEWCHEHKDKQVPDVKSIPPAKSTESASTEHDVAKPMSDEEAGAMFEGKQEPVLEASSKPEKPKRDPATIQSFTDLCKSCKADFGMAAQEVLKERNLTSWRDSSETPTEAYIQIAAVRQ